jgi:hypothetical protein
MRRNSWILEKIGMNTWLHTKIKMVTGCCLGMHPGSKFIYIPSTASYYFSFFSYKTIYFLHFETLEYIFIKFHTILYNMFRSIYIHFFVFFFFFLSSRMFVESCKRIRLMISSEDNIDFGWYIFYLLAIVFIHNIIIGLIDIISLVLDLLIY